MPEELKACLAVGSDTTLMVWADLDDNMPDGDALKREFWAVADKAGIAKSDFDSVVFVFAKDRLENWIEFLESGSTDETREGKRVKYPKQASDAANKLADRCRSNSSGPELPPSLSWSCQNWRTLCDRMG
jgi:hypothetical protein